MTIPRLVHPALLLSALLGFLPATPSHAVTPAPGGDADYEDSRKHIFLDDELLFIEVTLDSTDFADLLNQPWLNDYKRCTVRFRNSLIDETVSDIGIRVRGNTSRAGIKKSWKLSFNEFVEGGQFHGLERFNMNGERNDPSAIRTELGFEMHRKMGVPAPRAHHVHLTINDGRFVEGIYINIEQVDEEFAESRFGNKNGTLYKCRYRGSRSDLRWVAPGDGAAYSNLADRQTYDEKRFDEDSDYEDLAAFINFINFSDNETFASELNQWFHLDDFLRAMAVDVAIGNWDNYWYGANNYYLYMNEETNRFEYVPWDLDNTYGVDFFGTDWARRNVNNWGSGGFGSLFLDLPPLIRRILAIPDWTSLLKSYVRDVAEGPLRLSLNEDRIDQLQAMLQPYIFLGSFSDNHMDWGWDWSAFMMSFDSPTSFGDARGPWDYGIKPFHTIRTNHILTNVATQEILSSLSISEIVAHNRHGDRDEEGDRDDWIELFNDWPARVPLGGMYLSDNPNAPKKWRIPDGTVIEAREYLRIWCDGETDEGRLHADVDLDETGGRIGIWHTDNHRNVLIDYVEFPAIGPDVSYIRREDDIYPRVYSAEPTPGEANSYAGNLPPQIIDISLDPLLPTDDTPVTISARVIELDGILAGVKLHVDRGNGFEATLLDEVTETGGALSNGRLFRAELAGAPEGTRIAYYFEATDDSGATSFEPSMGADLPLVYVVDYQPPALFLNEFMPRNSGVVTDDRGEAESWVEIFNGSSKSIDLGGYAFSVDPDVNDLFLFPSLLIEPGGYLVIWCDGEPDEGDLHADFRLDQDGGVLVLRSPAAFGSMVIDQYEYGLVDEDFSFGRGADGGESWVTSSEPTPGKSNSGGSTNSDPWGSGRPRLAVWPNPVPMNGAEAIVGFSMPAQGRATIRLYDVAGREVSTLLDIRLAPGVRRIPIDFRALVSNETAQGIYFLRLETPVSEETTKIILVR